MSVEDLLFMFLSHFNKSNQSEALNLVHDAAFRSGLVESERPADTLDLPPAHTLKPAESAALLLAARLYFLFIEPELSDWLRVES